MLYKRWMVTMAAFGLVFAAVMVLAAVFRLSPYEAMVAGMFPGGDAAPLGNAGWFHAGIAGGIFAGWSTMLLVLALDDRLVAQPAVWHAATAGLVVWYLVDSAASVLTGAALNVVGNTVFLGLYLPPLLALRRGGTAVGREATRAA